jgi:hypothetical protein
MSSIINWLVETQSRSYPLTLSPAPFHASLTHSPNFHWFHCLDLCVSPNFHWFQYFQNLKESGDFMKEPVVLWVVYLSLLNFFFEICGYISQLALWFLLRTMDMNPMNIHLCNWRGVWCTNFSYPPSKWNVTYLNQWLKFNQFDPNHNHRLGLGKKPAQGLPPKDCAIPYWITLVC